LSLTQELGKRGRFAKVSRWDITLNHSERFIERIVSNTPTIRMDQHLKKILHDVIQDSGRITISTD